MDTKKPEFFNSLEGIRGYAFLAVFFLHYNLLIKRPTSLMAYPAYLACNLGWFLVPIFFVLSGFLITRVLLNTKEREGYFKIFYLRRAVRILPLYYIVIVAIGIIAVAKHWSINPKHLLYLFYMQNFTQLELSSSIHINHFWSLAVEEQFYLLWPVAIWFLRSEKSVLNFCYTLIAACCLFRVAWPLWGLPMSYGYFITPARVDGIILGAVLAIHYKRATNWTSFVRAAKVGIPILLLGMLAVTLIAGSTFPDSYVGIALCTPAMNLLGMGFVILALTPGNVVARVCSGSKICKFGKLTYGLYVFHYLYCSYFLYSVAPALARYMPRQIAHLASSGLALGLTTTLAFASYKLLEEPAMAMKERFKYGPVVVREEKTPIFRRPLLVFDSAE